MEDTGRRYRARLESLRRQRDEVDQAVGRGNLARLAELEGLDSRLAAMEASYASLLVESGSGLEAASILDNATPAQPIGRASLAQTLLFGLLGSLAAGIALAAFLHSLDDTIRDPQDVGAAIGQAPLAVVGHIATRTWDEARRQSRLVTLVEPRSGPAEAFCTLRANLRLLRASGRPFRSLVVTSAIAHEGKTLVASNLAVAFAQAGDRVLLVDADLRRPSVHTIFGVDTDLGLVDALMPGAGERLAASGQGPVASGESLVAAAGSAPAASAPPAMPVVRVGLVENLWLLPAGSRLPDLGRVLGSGAMARLVEQLGPEWDVVIFDTPPVGPIADTLLLVAQADASLLVARAGETHRGSLQRALEVLSQTGRAVMGVVLNDLRPGPLDRYGPYGDAAYYYAYGKSGYGDANGAHGAPAGGRSASAARPAGSGPSLAAKDGGATPVRPA